MPRLHIALEEGFVGDAVLLRIDGRKIFEQPAAKTRTQIGLAATHEEQLPSGAHTIEVVLPQRHLSRSIPVSLDSDMYVGISVGSDGFQEPRIANKPFGYA